MNGYSSNGNHRKQCCGDLCNSHYIRIPWLTNQPKLGFGYESTPWSSLQYGHVVNNNKNTKNTKKNRRHFIGFIGFTKLIRGFDTSPCDPPPFGNGYPVSIIQVLGPDHDFVLKPYGDDWGFLMVIMPHELGYIPL